MSNILLIGKTGQVGFELERVLQPLGGLLAPDHSVLDLTMQVNAIGPGIIAEEAKRINALLLHYSTTFVFDGMKGEPYTEDDPPNPVNVYGRSKLAGERAIIASEVPHIILRANWVYSARRRNFALTMLKIAREHAELNVVTDQVGSPTWARDYAGVTAELLRKPARLLENPGIYNLSAASHCSRMKWAEKLIGCALNISPDRSGWAELCPTTTAQFPLPAKRPLYTVTSNQKFEKTFGITMPVWEDRIDAFVRTLSQH